MITAVLAFLLLPALLLVAWVVMSAWQARRTGSSWIVNACLLLSVAGALVAAAGAVTTARDVHRTHAHHDAITSPVAWYSSVAVRDLVTDTPIGTVPGARNEIPTKTLSNDEANRQSHATRLEGRARIVEPRNSERLLWSLWKMAPWLVALVAFASVFPVMRNASVGDPFAASSIRAVQVLGWTLLIGLSLREVVEMLLSDASIQGHAWIGDPPLSTGGNLFMVLPGLAVLALGAVFRAGATSRELELATV